MNRCAWCETDALLRTYHDEEWGLPIHDDRKHFEFLVLEVSQSGLSWLTVLRKRENYRAAFDGFDPEKVAAYNAEKVQVLMQNPGIIRNQRKIEAAILNAGLFLEIQREFGSFDQYLWAFVDGQPVIHHYESWMEIPAITPLSDQVSKDLKSRGFKFLGSTVIYAHLQAAGIVDDHEDACFRKPLYAPKEGAIK